MPYIPIIDKVTVDEMPGTSVEQDINIPVKNKII